MSDRHLVEEKIAWYVNGTLDEAGRREVERALADSPKIAALLEQARLNLALAGLASPEEVLSPIHPRILVDYVEKPETMDPSLRAFVEAEVDKGGPTRECVERLYEVEAALRSAEKGREAIEETPTFFARIWSALAASVLRPVPALAYLLVLAAMVPLLLQGVREPTVAPAGLLERIVVDSDRSVRADGTAETELLAIAGSFAAGDVLLLELRTDLAPEDLERTDLSYRSEILRGGETLWSGMHDRSHFEIRADGSVILPLPIYPASLDSGAEYLLRIVVLAPGDPLDGEALYQRRFAIRP